METFGDVNCLQVVPDRHEWRALLNTLLKFRVPQKVGLFSDELSDCQLIKDSAKRCQL